MRIFNFYYQQKLTALHIACRDGRTDMADVIIQAAEKQAMISHSGKYIKYQANIQTLLNMAGPEVELVSSQAHSNRVAFKAMA